MQQADPTPVELRYWMFSHLDEITPPDDSYADLFDDPLLPMRHVAAELAGVRRASRALPDTNGG
jgi:hypothetical protein